MIITLANKTYRVTENVVRNVESGRYKEQYGLDTSDVSVYHHYRIRKQDSDTVAQIHGFLANGLLVNDYRQLIIRERM